jgi:hypothetical protein
MTRILLRAVQRVDYLAGRENDDGRELAPVRGTRCWNCVGPTWIARGASTVANIVVGEKFRHDCRFICTVDLVPVKISSACPSAERA